jgi:hypothetical protein
MLKYLVFPYLVIMLCLNALAFGWDVIYECNETPPNANPVWQVREGNDALGSVVPDPEVPGNNLLFINDDGGEKIKWKIAWNADNSTGTTVVFRARVEATGGDSAFLTVRDGTGREDVRWTDVGTIKLDMAGIVYELEATAWHIYRITTCESDIFLYVDEASDPAIDGKGKLSASGDNEIYFGSVSSGGTVVWYLDYLLYSLIGPNAPGEEPQLPNTVVGGAKAVDFAGKLATTWGGLKR